MLSVSVSDVKPSEYPDRIQVVSTESEGKTDAEFQYVVEVKKIIDGPHGRVVMLSRVRGPSIEDGDDQVGVHDRFFYYDNGINEIPAQTDHHLYPPDGMLDSVDAYLDHAEEVVGGDPVAAYDQVETKLG